jgi:hypothetical protein
MLNANTISLAQRKFNTLPNWVQNLLDEMAQRPVKITRTETKDLCRAIFGAVGLRDVPPGKGRRVLRLPNSDDLLVLDYAKRAPRFEPSWVKCCVRCGAWRMPLRPMVRLDHLVSLCLGPMLRLLRIVRGGGLRHAA